MANRIQVSESITILELFASGWPKLRIARELDLDVKTVRRCIREAAAANSKSLLPPPGPAGEVDSKGTVPPVGDSLGNTQIPSPGPGSKSLLLPAGKNGRSSSCEPYRKRITDAVESGLTAQRIYQDLTADGFAGAYDSVKRFVRKLFPGTAGRVHRMECLPGEEAQVDFGLGAPIRLPGGKLKRTWVFRVVLSYSRKAYSETVLRQTTENFIRCLENAFRSFGGVALVINLDNLRAAVQRADWCDPDLNPKLLAFCRHYGCALLPCRPRTPQHKGKTERGISYMKSNALRGRTFPSLAAHNEFLRHWEKTVADVRIHGTTRRQVAVLFAEEQKALRPLPPDLFPCFQEGKRTVHRDCYVEVDKAYYTVPPEYIGATVWARWDGREVRIFNQRWEQICLHARLAPGQFDKSLGLGGGTGPLHRQLDHWLKRAQELGGPCGQWSQGVLQHKGPLGLRSIMGLLRLADHHSFKTLNDACASALSRGAWRLRDVRALLEQRQREVQTHFGFAQSHPLIRNLAEYGLFIETKITA